MENVSCHCVFSFYVMYQAHLYIWKYFPLLLHFLDVWDLYCYSAMQVFDAWNDLSDSLALELFLAWALIII